MFSLTWPKQSSSSQPHAWLSSALFQLCKQCYHGPSYPSQKPASHSWLLFSIIFYIWFISQSCQLSLQSIPHTHPSFSWELTFSWSFQSALSSSLKTGFFSSHSRAHNLLTLITVMESIKNKKQRSKSLFVLKTIVFRMLCLAWVLPKDPFTIVLCPVFGATGKW